MKVNGIRTSDQARLAHIIEALTLWTGAAADLKLRVPSLTTELLDETGQEVVARIVFDLDPETNEYSYRTI